LARERQERSAQPKADKGEKKNGLSDTERMAEGEPKHLPAKAKKVPHSAPSA
jgi:hypothetical protein